MTHQRKLLGKLQLLIEIFQTNLESRSENWTTFSPQLLGTLVRQCFTKREDGLGKLARRVRESVTWASCLRITKSMRILALPAVRHRCSWIRVTVSYLKELLDLGIKASAAITT